MGNETASVHRRTRSNNKNSFSLDFNHHTADKILPRDSHSNSFRLEKINSGYKAPHNKFSNFQAFDDIPNKIQNSQSEIKSNIERINPKRISQLVKINDKLRKELITISNQLTMKVKKKKYKQKNQQEDQSAESIKNRQALQRQLANAYKQIDMYKKTIETMKQGGNTFGADSAVIQVQNKIAHVDLEIEKVMNNIQAQKNVNNSQSSAMNSKKNYIVKLSVKQSKKEIDQLKQRLKLINIQSRKREKKYMQQHQTMFALEDKIKQLEKEELNEEIQATRKKQQQKKEERKAEIEEAQKELQALKIRHDEYHKKINGLLIEGKMLKQTKKELKTQLEDRKKQIQNLKYKRDAFVKQIKDNLDFFATKQESKDEQLSQFQSDDQEEMDPVEEEQDQRGTFDIDHLKDHKIKQKMNEQKSKVKKHQPAQKTEVKTEPKLWKTMVTRMVQRGHSKPGQKKFVSGVKSPKRQMKIVMMNIWMNKKKQLLSIQPIYLIDNVIYDGNKSSQNIEDEYKVTYQLEEFDYLKSILGIFGKQGFLEYIVLQSNFGKISKVGRGQTIGDNFAIGVAKQETPVQIFGACSSDGMYNRINRLDVEVLFDYSINKG